MKKNISWKIISGLVCIMAFVIPLWILWEIINQTDAVWNALFWQWLIGRKLYFVGLPLSLLICYLVGNVIETRMGTWFQEKVLRKLPIIRYFISAFNPRVREVLQKTHGALLVEFQSQWKFGFLSSVHRTAEGVMGNVIIGTIPPSSQVIDETSWVKVKITKEGRYEMIPAEIALKHELSGGTAVPIDAYRDVQKISFKTLVDALHLLQNDVVLP